MIRDPSFRPPVPVPVDDVPVAESLWQVASFAAVLAHVENDMEHLQIGEADAASRLRQQRCNALVLHWCAVNKNRIRQQSTDM